MSSSPSEVRPDSTQNNTEQVIHEHVNGSTTDALAKAVQSMDGEHEDNTSSIDQPLQIVTSAIPHTDNTTLQSLLNSVSVGGTAQLISANGEPHTIEIISVNNELICGQGDQKQVWQLVPASNNQQAFIVTENSNEEQAGDGGLQHVVPVSGDFLTSQGMIPIQSNLPENCPPWAMRLRDCEQIGDSYRGWVENEVELDLLLTYHKQQTSSFWGTRQSPSTSKPATRLMWKSQYVPFDGVPFVNSGSRAVVMECQFGPRRKGSQFKKDPDHSRGYKQTCPARIYIKKVKKFPEDRVMLSLDKKSLKIAMDRVFQELKQKGLEEGGQERWYVQLPTDSAHDFHADTPLVTQYPISGDESREDNTNIAPKLDHRVNQRIRDIVSGGETRLYAVRKQLRKFVERDLFDQSEDIPERHNLCLFPTVHNLQNHIHQALKDIETGILPVTAPAVNVEVITSTDGHSESDNDFYHTGIPDSQAETVTVTLTQAPDQDGQHVISRVETHLSDGTTQISDTISAETAQLLSKLHPNMFPSGTLFKVQQNQVIPTSPPIQVLSDGQGQELTFQIVQESVDIPVMHDGAVISSTPESTEDMKTELVEEQNQSSL